MRSSLVTAAVLVLVGPLALASPAQPTRQSAPVGAGAIQTGLPIFEPYQAYPVGSWPESVAILDVTGDGLNDVLMTTSFYFDDLNDYKLFIFVQQPDGTLSAPLKRKTDIAYGGLASLATGDLNGDGRDDVAIATASGVDMFLNGPARLGTRRLVPTSDEVYNLVIADVDGDGRNDMVVGGRLGLQVLRNTGHGFTARSVTTDPQWEVEVGDLNGDGRLDIGGCSGLNECASILNVFYQQSDRRFSLQTYQAETDYWPGGDGIAVGDVTGDGRDDAVLTIPGNQPGALMNVWHQLTDGTLSDPIVRSSYDIPEAVVIADANADGWNDLVTLHGGWNQAGVYYYRPSNGDLSPESLYPIPYASHYNVKGLAVGDINGDGLPDIVLADYNNGLVVLRHKAP